MEFPGGHRRVAAHGMEFPRALQYRRMPSRPIGLGLATPADSATSGGLPCHSPSVRTTVSPAGSPFERWRTASKRQTAAATETFRLSAEP